MSINQKIFEQFANKYMSNFYHKGQLIACIKFQMENHELNIQQAINQLRNYRRNAKKCFKCKKYSSWCITLSSAKKTYCYDCYEGGYIYE